MATIGSKLRYLCNDSKVNVLKSYNSVQKEVNKQTGNNEITTGNAHRIFRPVWLHRLGQSSCDDVGIKCNKLKKKRVPFSTKFNLLLACSTGDFLPNQKSAGSNQAFAKHIKLSTYLGVNKTGLLKEVPVSNQETETVKFSHFRLVDKANIIRRYKKHSTANNKKINKQIRISPFCITEIRTEFLKPVDKENANLVTRMLKSINLNNILFNSINIKKRVIFYDTRRHYHIKMIRYMSNTAKIKDIKSNKNIVNSLIKETTAKDNKTNENDVSKINNNIKYVYTNRHNKINLKNPITKSHEETKNDFNMNKTFAEVSMIQNLGMTMRKENRHNYVNYIRNFIKNNDFVSKRNHTKTKGNNGDNIHQDPTSKTDIDIITKKLKKINSLDDNPKVSKYTESNKMELQKEDHTKYKQNFKGSGDSKGNSMKHIGMNPNEEKNLKLQNHQKLIPPEPDNKSKHTTCEQYIEDKSLESHSHKRKINKTSLINMNVQHKNKSDKKLDSVTKTIEKNKTCLEENREIANSKNVVNINHVKLSELKVQTPQNSTKNDSKIKMNFEEKKNDTNKLVNKLLINKETSEQIYNPTHIIQLQDNNYLKQRIKEKNKNIITEKAKEDIKEPKKSTTVNDKEIESKALSPNYKISSLKSNLIDIKSNVSQNLSEIIGAIKTSKYVEKAKKKNTKPEKPNKTELKKIKHVKKKKDLLNLKLNLFNSESNLSQNRSEIVMTNKKSKFTEEAEENIRKPDRSTAVNSKELKSTFQRFNKNHDLLSLISNKIFDLEANLSQNLSEMLLASKTAQNKSLNYSTTAKVLSLLREISGDPSKSVFMRYKNSENMANENYSNDNNGKYMKKEKPDKDKVGFVYKRQASCKIDMNEIENKKWRLRKMKNTAYNKNSAHMRFDTNNYEKQIPMIINFKKQAKLSNLHYKQYLKNIIARSIFTLNTAVAVDLPKSESTSNENKGFVKEKKRYNKANKLNSGGEFGVIWNKIKVSKPKLLGNVNPKHEVMTKERRNSLERFQIFYNRISQENIHQYKKRSFHINAPKIRISNTAVKSKQNKLTGKKHDYVKPDYVKPDYIKPDYVKLQHFPLTHGSEFSEIRKKIKIAKPKILSYINSKQYMTKERRESLESFKIFYNRIAQENIRQYRVNADKLNYSGLEIK